MKYCHNMNCQGARIAAEYQVDYTYCPNCRSELALMIRCLCGQDAFNPMARPTRCAGCHVVITEAYLIECMAAQFQKMSQEIARQKAV